MSLPTVVRTRSPGAAMVPDVSTSHQQFKLVAGMTFVALLMIASAVSRWEGRGSVSIGTVVVWVAPTWLLWAVAGVALIPIVRAVQRRFGDPVLRICAHVALGGVAIYAYCVVLHFVQLQLHLSDLSLPWWSAGWMIARFRVFENSLIYGAIVAFVLISDLVARFRAQSLTSQRLSAELANARLEALRLKLNPHFLFNALNGATMLMRSGENARAIQAVVGLSTLLRQLLEERETLVTLDRELAFIESYVDVERVRFGDRLTMVVDASREARDARVPFLALQPLVENSIHHGIARSGDGGQITIAARRDGELLDVRVTNDGPAPAAPARARGAGVGLDTTRQRLAQLFGERYELSLDAQEGSATTVVRLRIPFCAEPLLGQP